MENERHADKTHKTIKKYEVTTSVYKNGTRSLGIRGKTLSSQIDFLRSFGRLHTSKYTYIMSNFLNQMTPTSHIDH